MTKTARILRLLELGKTPAEIAKIVDCRTEYVRVVRQRKQHPQRFKKYSAKASVKRMERYRSDPEYRDAYLVRDRISRARRKAEREEVPQ